MPAPKLYPHERLFAMKQRDTGLDWEDYPAYVQELVTSFNVDKIKVQGYSAALERGSMLIKEEMEDFLDKYEEEEEDEEVVVKPAPTPAPPKVELPKPQPVPVPAKVEAPKPAPAPVKPAPTPKLSADQKREMALEKLFNSGRKEDITRSELEKAGFDTAFGFALDGDGWKKGKRFCLKKERKEKNYRIIQLG